MSKRAIYTVIMSMYDSLKVPNFIEPGFDYICFTDNKELKSDFWKIRLIEKSGVKAQREIKILAHKFLPEYDLTVYIDGNMTLNKSIADLVDIGADWIIKQHPVRRNIYQEGVRVIQLKKGDANVVNRQLRKYILKGFNKSILFETGFMIRRNVPKVNEVCEAWWEQVKEHSHRDQLSLPFVLNGYKPEVLPAARMNSYISILRHDGGNYVPTIHYINPGRADKNIGKAYNQICALIPENDWICIQDQDSLFWPELCLKQIETIIQNYGNEYSLFGAVTNRLNSQSQRPFPTDFENLDILYHKKRAEELAVENWGKVEDHGEPVAGLFMLFPKRLWNEVKFIEKSIYCDSLFGKEVLKKKKKIGLMTGVYVYHFYRADKPNPTAYKKHLIA